MGCLALFEDDQPLEEKIKILADEELLEIWAESQRMENAIHSQIPEACVVGPNFEQAIVTELYLRNGLRLVKNQRP